MQRAAVALEFLIPVKISLLFFEMLCGYEGSFLFMLTCACVVCAPEVSLSTW